ncbi:MAG TPA: multiheme c-type cytochrome [Polyangiales bacterium]|nr:multiheme c-type cytochrome [Polyangiales bacterium]
MARVARTLWLLAMLACSDAVPREPLSVAELLDPQSCKDCHPRHYAEWSGSMHAYAMRDPVFQAMNRRGQEETGGELRDFCLKCHAPLALREEAIDDFADLTDVPEHLQGVTCYFCHNVASVEKPHNNASLTLAGDNRMRGALKNPVEPYAHRVEYSKFLDPGKLDSSLMCGSCHDIQMPNGFHIERTLEEYQGSVFAQDNGFQSCSSCHTRFKERREPAADYDLAQVPARVVHEHTWPGVDVALDEFPNSAAQRVLIERCMFGVRTTFVANAETLGRNPSEYFAFKVFLESTNVGHNVPSGASQDRRLWLEVHAFEGDREVFVSGAIADDQLEQDSQLFLFRDRLLDEHGEETHMFWRASQRAPDSTTLVTTTPANALSPLGHGAEYRYVTGVTKPPARLELKLRMRPMGRDVLEDLVDSGHLDPAVMERMPTFTVAEWQGEFDAKTGTYLLSPTSEATCEEYERLMNPED